MKNLKSMKGITLIALVITIIVLLILAGVSIAMLTGENGIIIKAKDSKNNTIIAKEKEFVNLAYSAASVDSLGTGVTAEKMQEKLDNLTGKGKTIVTLSKQILKIVFIETENEYELEIEKSDNEIDMTEILSSISTKFDEYLAQAKQKGQTTEAAIGIGTDGSIVNLDLWNYYKTDDGIAMSLGKGDGCSYTQGYKGDIIDGMIQGPMPQYIYIKSEGKSYSVRELIYTFCNSTMSVFPEIPSTVTKLDYQAFAGCKNLTNVVIPSNVIIFNGAVFRYCTALTDVYFEHTEVMPSMRHECFLKSYGSNDSLITFHFKNETMYNVFGFYGSVSKITNNGTKSTDYDWDKSEIEFVGEYYDVGNYGGSY